MVTSNEDGFFDCSLCCILVSKIKSEWTRELPSWLKADDSKSCVIPSWKDANQGYSVSVSSDYVFLYHLYQGPAWINALPCASKGPQRIRAWTLRRRALAIRSLHFFGYTLLWDCRTVKAPSQLPWAEMQYIDSEGPSLLLLNDLVVDTVDFGSLAMRN